MSDSLKLGASGKKNVKQTGMHIYSSLQHNCNITNGKKKTDEWLKRKQKAVLKRSFDEWIRIWMDGQDCTLAERSWFVMTRGRKTRRCLVRIEVEWWDRGKQECRTSNKENPVVEWGWW